MLILILIASLISLISGYCDTDETLSVKHYYELGCQPTLDPYGRIERFNCPDFRSLDKDKCHYRGKLYNGGELIEEQYLGPCEGGCFCGRRFGETPAQFVCNYKYCPEHGAFYAGKCVFQRSIGNCCAENIICNDETRLRSLHKCYLDNNSYYEGERMYPRKECRNYQCICDNQFNEFTDPSLNPKCELINHKCELELRHLYQFQMGCAPVYYGDYPTCPDDLYRCPKVNDRIVPGNYYDSPGNVCTFGHLTLRKGDRLDDTCYNCTCAVPPMLFCRVRSNCISY